MHSGLRIAAAVAVAIACVMSGEAAADQARLESPDTEAGDAIHLDDASMPDPVRTPGAFNETAKAAELCDADRADAATAPAHALCEAAFAEREIGQEHQYEYACVFLVPTAIGGIPTKRNVWLQPASEAHWKRALDGEIRKRVCGNEIAVSQAQREVAGDWVGAYRRYILPTDRLIVRAQPAYDPKDDPGRSRTVRGLSQDQAVVPADVPQTAGQNSQPIEASVTPGLGQGGLQGGLQGGAQSGGGLGGPQGPGGGVSGGGLSGGGVPGGGVPSGGVRGGGVQSGGALQPGSGPRPSRPVTSARRGTSAIRGPGR